MGVVRAGSKDAEEKGSYLPAVPMQSIRGARIRCDYEG